MNYLNPPNIPVEIWTTYIIPKSDLSLNFRLVCKDWSQWTPHFLMLMTNHIYSVNPQFSFNFYEKHSAREIQKEALIELKCFNNAMNELYKTLGLSYLLSELFIFHPDQFTKVEREKEELQDSSLYLLWEKVNSLIGNGSRELIVPDVNAPAKELRTFFYNVPKDFNRITLLGRITRLVLYGDKNLKAIPIEINFLSGLETLLIVETSIKSVPEWFSFPNMKVLRLSNNNIEAIPDLEGLPKLEYLNLNCNKIKNIPDLKLNNLIKLKLYDNQIEVIPDFSNFFALESLNIGKNKISKIPDFTNLPNIISLNLCQNSLTALPNFFHVPQLKELFALQNKITSLPDFTNLINLETLNLESNALSSLKVIPDLPNLKSLNLANNSLSSVPCLNSSKNILRLNISCNSLTEFENLKYFSSVKILEARDCSIEDIFHLQNMSSLANLNLRGNPLTNFSVNSSSPLCTNLRVLDLHGVPLLEIANLTRLTALSYVDIGQNTMLRGQKAIMEFIENNQ